ncbi:MAG TPA: hypothetical protein VMI13_05090 [Solirubrobacteraceae bacterium]|nr:hypothetical protein [Solirubrobacteraceae bacterium]
MSIVGLCIVAAMALSAMVASTASAAPELGQCVKLGKYTIPKEKKGKYGGENGTADPTCTQFSWKLKSKTLHAKNEKGSYEWVPGAPGKCTKLSKAKGKYADGTCEKLHEKCKKVVECSPDGKGEWEKIEPYDNGPGFKAVGTAPGILTIPTEKLTTECKNYSAAGKATSATKATVVAKFVECEIQGTKEVCESLVPAASPGEITTQLLDVETIEPATGVVGPKFTAAEANLADYECGKKTHGKVAGFLTAKYKSGAINKMGKELTESAGPGEVEQKLTESFSFSGGPFGPFAEGTQSDASTITYDSEVEIRTVAPDCKGACS